MRLLALPALFLISTCSFASETGEITQAPEGSDTSAAVSTVPTNSASAADGLLLVWNNSQYDIFVIQKGATHRLGPKLKEVFKNTDVDSVSVSPAPEIVTPGAAKPVKEAPIIKFVTLTGKKGACEYSHCLFVQ